MNIDEQLQAIVQLQIETRRDLDTLTKIHLDNDHDYREYRAWAAANDREQRQRIDALTAAVQQDAQNIRALARIADMHDRRLTDLEGGPRT